MEDLVSLLPKEEKAQCTGRSPPRQEAVHFDVAAESIALVRSSEVPSNMKNNPADTEASDTEGTTVDEDYRYTTVLLVKDKKRNFCPSYHSHDPEKSITPFAVILLAVLFAIYILNQADRLVLPVAIPSGLRCEITEKNECRNLTNVKSEGYTLTSLLDLGNSSANASNKTADCIDFNDYEQGLLTGKYCLFFCGW